MSLCACTSAIDSHDPGKLVKSVVEVIELVLEEPVDFVLATAESAAELRAENFSAADGYIDPVSTTIVAVGDTFKIAPLPLDLARTVPSSGSVDDLGYLLANAPDGFYINSETGAVLAQFGSGSANRTFVITTRVQDKSGLQRDLESISLTAQYRDTDSGANGPNGLDCANGKAVDEILFNRHFVCDCTGTVFTGTNCETLRASCPQNTARINATCRSFEVAPLAGRTRSGPAYLEPLASPTVAVGEAFRIARRKLDLLATNVTSGSVSEIRFSLVGAPEGFFVNSETGTVLAQFEPQDAATGNFSITMVATDASGLAANLETFQLRTQYEDTDPILGGRFGPMGGRYMGKGCGAGLNVDDVRFDRHYTCDCSATKFSGPNCDVLAEPSNSASGSDSGSADSGGMVAGVLLAIFVLLLIAGLGLHKFRVHTISMRAFDFLAEMDRLKQAGELDLDENAGPKVPREIKRGHITLLNKIGAGAFGEVWKGVLDESSAGGVPGYPVAVKTSKEAHGEGADELCREATVMAQVTGHPNLVALIGVVTSGTPLLLLLSICENGALNSYLKGLKERNAAATLDDSECARMGLEIAGGVQHLHANRLVHRDLAARNVLVGAQITMKVADFGLSRATKAANEADGEEGGGEYYRSQNGMFPVRWTSPETMESLVFTTASDVWSFGVTMVEIYTFAERPYPEMDNATVIHQLHAGYRIPKPNSCSDAMYGIVLQCWAAEAVDRPSFAAVVEALSRITAGRGGGAGIYPGDAAEFSAPGGQELFNDAYTAPVGIAVPEAGSRHSMQIAEGVSPGPDEYEQPVPVSRTSLTAASGTNAAADGQHEQTDATYDLASPTTVPAPPPRARLSLLVDSAPASNTGSTGSSAAAGGQHKHTDASVTYDMASPTAIPTPSPRAPTPLLIGSASASTSGGVCSSAVVAAGIKTTATNLSAPKLDSATLLPFEASAASSAALAVTETSIDAVIERRGHEPGEVLVSGKLYRFSDLDGDGAMSMEEAIMDGMDEEQFRAIDVQGNGEITLAEFQSFALKHSSTVDVKDQAKQTGTTQVPPPRPGMPKRSPGRPAKLVLGSSLTETDTDTALSSSAGSAAKPAVVQAPAYLSTWRAAKPVNGYLAAVDVGRILATSELTQQQLSAIWKEAKNPKRPKGKMDEGEFAAAAALVIVAGGRPIFNPLSI